MEFGFKKKACIWQQPQQRRTQHVTSKWQNIRAKQEKKNQIIYVHFPSIMEYTEKHFKRD